MVLLICIKTLSFNWQKKKSLESLMKRKLKGHMNLSLNDGEKML